jgi:hypothetical protein
MLREVEGLLEEGGRLSRKRLEQIGGFLLYVTRTSLCMVPYLIRFHLTIDGWRSNRDEKGWRLSMQVLKLQSRAAEELEGDAGVAGAEEALLRWLIRRPCWELTLKHYSNLWQVTSRSYGVSSAKRPQRLITDSVMPLV